MKALIRVGICCFLASYVQCINIGFVYLGSNGGSVLETTLSYLDKKGVNVPADINIREIFPPTEDITLIIDKVCEEIANNTVVFVAVAPCSTLTILDAAVVTLSVPIIGITTDHCPEYVDMTSISLVQTPVSSVHASLAILHVGGFTKTAILTDQSQTDISHLRSSLSSGFYESSVSYLNNLHGNEENAVASWLAGVSGSDPEVTCLILMLEELSLKTLSQEMTKSMEAVSDHVVVVVSDIDVSSSAGLEGLSVFRDVLWLRQTVFHSNVLTDSSSLQRLQVQIGEGFRALFEAITSSSVTVVESTNITTEYCGNKLIDIPSINPVLLENLNKGKTNSQPSDQYDILRLEFENQTVTSKHIATWSDEAGLDFLGGTQLFTETSQGLGNITLKVVTNVAAPFVMKLPNGTGWEGFCIDILDELASRMNFRYELFQSPDKLWGTVDDEGNWNGVVEVVRKKDADLGIGPISLTSEREEVIDFTKPYMEEGAGIVLKRFEDKSSKIFRMFKPFSESVWLTIAAAVVVVGFTLAIVNRLSPGYNKDEGEEVKAKERIRTSDNIWIVYESYMEQGAETSPPNISGRFILGFWWIFTILMVASYKANLVAFLTVNFMNIPINTIHDLAEQDRILPLVKQGSNLYQELKKGETETFRKLWSMMQAAPSVTNSDEALEYVLTGGYAFLTDQSQIEFLRTLDCDSLMSAETPFNVGGIGFIVPESSPLLEMMSINIIQLQEAGLTRKWRRRWWSSSDMCQSQTQASTVQSLDLESTGGPFLVFAGSTTIAVLCLGMECIWWKTRGCGKRKRNRKADNRSNS